LLPLFLLPLFLLPLFLLPLFLLPLFCSPSRIRCLRSASSKKQAARQRGWWSSRVSRVPPPLAHTSSLEWLACSGRAGVEGTGPGGVEVEAGSR
jgi:hypothetical protein